LAQHVHGDRNGLNQVKFQENRLRIVPLALDAKPTVHRSFDRGAAINNIAAAM